MSEEMNKKLRDVFTCPICGQPKVHYRLYGYRCQNPEHHEVEQEMRRKAIMEAVRRRGLLDE